MQPTDPLQAALPVYRDTDFPRMLVIGLAYGLLAAAMLRFGMADLLISTVWLPSGLGLAALLAYGARFWPAIAVSALIANLASGVPLAPSLAFTLGNTLQPLLVLWVLRRLQTGANAPRSFALEHLRDYRRLGLAVCIALPLTALATTTLLQLVGAIPPEQFASGVFRFALTNLLGILLMTPLLLTWCTLPRGWFSTGKRAFETLALFGLAFLAGQTIFLGWFSQTFGHLARPYWTMFFIFWAALRYGRHGALLLVFLLVSQGLLGAALGVGHFSNDIQNSHLVNLQMTIVTGVLSGLVLSQTLHDLMQSRDELKVAAMVFEVSSEAMLVTDAAKRVIRINPAFTTMTGYSPTEVIGQPPRILNPGLNDEGFYNQLWASVRQTGSWRGEIRNLRKNGDPFVAVLSINTIFDQQGAIQGWVGLFSDITQQKETQGVIWKQANIDTLTGLPNRHRLSDIFLDQLTRRGAAPLALLLIDLDRFRSVNETLGHAIGDDLLREAARRIVARVPTAEVVSRLGSDEFVVLLSQGLARGELDAIANALLADMAQPYQLGDGSAHVSASIGITLYPQDGRDPSALRKCADLAVDAAKRLGGNTFHYYSNAMQESISRRMQLETDLHLALANQQLAVHYQPIVHIPSGKIRKAEALTRWQHPTLGPISPAEFIPIAEACGLIIRIGNWVFHQATMLAAQLRADHDVDFQISVNISPVQFRLNRDGWQHWAEHLASLNLPGQSVSVEITESLLMENKDEILDQLLFFRDMGMQVALDDFGTGYSSLAYLKKFDIDYLKIDRAFVQNISPHSSELSLCEAIVVMAHKLGLKVIAEGVETEEQCNMLRSIGCDYGQGFLFSRPIPADDFYALLGRSL